MLLSSPLLAESEQEACSELEARAFVGDGCGLGLSDWLHRDETWHQRTIAGLSTGALSVEWPFSRKWQLHITGERPVAKTTLGEALLEDDCGDEGKMSFDDYPWWSAQIGAGVRTKF